MLARKVNAASFDDLVLAAFGQSLLNSSSSQSFAPLVRDANETVSIRLHDQDFWRKVKSPAHR